MPAQWLRRVQDAMSGVLKCSKSVSKVKPDPETTPEQPCGQCGRTCLQQDTSSCCRCGKARPQSSFSILPVVLGSSPTKESSDVAITDFSHADAQEICRPDEPLAESKSTTLSSVGALLEQAEPPSSRSASEAGSLSPKSDSTENTERKRRSSTSSESSVKSNDITRAMRQVLCSGSLVTHSVKVRTLQLPDTLASAHATKPKPDPLMPVFDGKIDPENLINYVAVDFKDDLLSVQRVSLMGTEWLGMRLLRSTHADGFRFCLCAAALQNLGRKTSKSFVVEVCAEAVDNYSCVLAPIHDSRSSSKSAELLSKFLERVEGICELAAILVNEAAHPQKKVAADTKAWCQRKSLEYGEEQKRSSLSIKGFQRSIGSFLEGQMATLASEDRPRRRSEPQLASRRRRSEPQMASSDVKIGAERRRSESNLAQGQPSSLEHSTMHTRRRKSAPGHFGEDPSHTPCGSEPTSRMPTLDEGREPASGIDTELSHHLSTSEIKCLTADGPQGSPRQKSAAQKRSCSH